MSHARQAAPERYTNTPSNAALRRRQAPKPTLRHSDPEQFDRCIRRISRTLSVGLFVIFYWFSIQKFAPDVSPAEEVAGQTVAVLTAHMLPVRTGLLLLASWELVLGTALLFFPRSRIVLCTTFLHLSLTFTTFVVFPDLTLGATAGSLTLLGQYIVKNLVLLGGLYTLIELEWLQRSSRIAEHLSDRGSRSTHDIDRGGWDNQVFEDEWAVARR